MRIGFFFKKKKRVESITNQPVVVVVVVVEGKEISLSLFRVDFSHFIVSPEFCCFLHFSLSSPKKKQNFLNDLEKISKSNDGRQHDRQDSR